MGFIYVKFLIVSLAKEYKLNLVEELNFHDFYEKYSQKKELEELMNTYKIRDGMSEQEWDAICKLSINQY